MKAKLCPIYQAEEEINLSVPGKEYCFVGAQMVAACQSDWIPPDSKMTARVTVLVASTQLTPKRVLSWKIFCRRYFSSVLHGSKCSNWMTWLNLMEIMICFQSHNLTLPGGINEEDVKNTIAFVTWKWGVLYKVWIMWCWWLNFDMLIHILCTCSLLINNC